MSSFYSNKINRKSKALSRASYHMETEHKFTSRKARRALYILLKIHLKMKKLSKVADYLVAKQMLASPRKTRRARYNLRKINLKRELLSKAASFLRKPIVTSTKLEKQKIIYGDWLEEFYKLPPEVRVMIWKDILLPGESNHPLHMPSLVIVFRAEKEHIIYGEILEVYFKVTTLDLHLEQFTGEVLQWLNAGHATQRYQSFNLRLTKYLLPFRVENQKVNDYCRLHGSNYSMERFNDMPFCTSPTTDLRKLKISIIGRFRILGLYSYWLMEVIRVCVTRCEHFDTLEIVLESVSPIQRILYKIYLEYVETRLPLEVKKVLGVDCAFSLVNNDHDPIIYKWTWRSWANS
jgi:hypothetical protein